MKEGHKNLNNDLDEGPNCLAAQEGRGDFWLMLEEAMEQCRGGGSLERLSNERLTDIVEVLAQNGIRMVYMPEKHIGHIGNF